MLTKSDLRQLGWSDELIDSVVHTAALVSSGAVVTDLPTGNGPLTRLDIPAATGNVAFSGQTDTTNFVIENRR